MTAIDPIERWIDSASVELDPTSFEITAHGERFDALRERMAHARVVMLGEPNHFVHEKVEFRLWWLRRLAARRRIVIGEELSWFDGQHVARYLDDGDERHFDRMWTFGYKDAAHDDPTGILAASAARYPTALFKREQMRFYDGLRALPNVSAYFGFDIGGRSERHLRVAG